MTDLDADTIAEMKARLHYLTNALTPGTAENANTTFYEGKGEAMRAEIKRLEAELASRQGIVGLDLGALPDTREGLQEALLAVFEAFGMSVGVGLIKDGVAIRSQDERVDAQNVGVIEPYSAPYAEALQQLQTLVLQLQAEGDMVRANQLLAIGRVFRDQM